MDTSNASSPTGNSSEGQRQAQYLHNREVSRFTNQPSPMFPFSNNEMLTLTYQVFDLTEEHKAYSPFAPFTNLKVVNGSTQPIYIYFGEIGNYYDLIPANTTNIYNAQDMGGGLSCFKIYNAGTGTITAGQLLITAYKTGTTPTDAVMNFQSLMDKLFLQRLNKFPVRSF
jgi:hypothetical protein